PAFQFGRVQLRQLLAEISLTHSRRGMLDLDDPVKTSRPTHDARIQILRVIGGGNVDDPVDLIGPVQPGQQVLAGVQVDNGIDVLEDADHRAIGLDPAEALQDQGEDARLLAEDGDVPRLNDVLNDLVDHGALARALGTIEQVSPPMKESVAFKLVSLGPKAFDFLENSGRQAIGQINEVVDFQVLGLQLRLLAKLPQPALVGSRGQMPACGSASFIEATLHLLPF